MGRDLVGWKVKRRFNFRGLQGLGFAGFFCALFWAILGQCQPAVDDVDNRLLVIGAEGFALRVGKN